MNQEELNKIERKRKTTYSAIIIINIAIGVLFIITVISFLLLQNPKFNDFLIVPFITIALMAILIFANKYIKNQINKEISKAVYEPAFKEKNIEFRYDDGLTLNEVMSSQLLPHPDDFESNALIKGEISGFPYKASNITLWEVRETVDHKGRTHRTKVVIFDGRMYVMGTPFNKKGIIIKSKETKDKKILNNTIIAIAFLSITGMLVSNILPMLSDPFFRESLKEKLPFFFVFIASLIIVAISSFLSKRKKGYKKAKLESDQFNEYFDIETQDQIELRKTLTPAIMEKLISLRNSIGEFHLSIIGNKIFFAFPKSLTIKYNKPIQELIEEAKNSVDEEIKTIKSIIEALKLEEEKIKKGMVN
jgi:predicted membrane channel-forming protein YqfA (hemolysin III family)